MVDWFAEKPAKKMPVAKGFENQRGIKIPEMAGVHFWYRPVRFQDTPVRHRFLPSFGAKQANK